MHEPDDDDDEFAESVVRRTRPYFAAAADYFAAGWAPLPIPGKWPPPKGWTGGDGAWPSRADVEAWRMEQGDLNIGLRLPAHVLGIDVDNYGGKPGKATLESCEATWGPLPPTYASTSRRDGVSGIALFCVPEGMAWPSELPGGGVEIIRTAHRYAMVWPSLHPEGRTYQWVSTHYSWRERHAGFIPSPDALAALPQTWVDGLTGGHAAVEQARADLADAETSLWIAEHGGGAQCPTMASAVRRAAFDMVSPGSRHEAAIRGTARIAHLIQEGHTGGTDALGKLARGFDVSIHGDHSRAGEFARMVSGAVRLAVAVGPVAVEDPCHIPRERRDLFGNPSTIVMSAPHASTLPRHTPMSVAQLPEPARQAPQAPVVDLFSVITPDAAAPVSAGPDAAHAMAVEAEAAALRIRAEARAVVAAEDWVKRFREPTSHAHLGEDLLLPDAEISYRVAEVLPVGGNVLLTAGFKAGKTTLINNLARSLADGEPFLGKLDVQVLDEGRVSLWNYEVGEGQYRRWLRDSDIQHPQRVSVLNLRGYSMPLTAPKVVDWIVRWHIEHATRIWFIDPFARAYGGVSENDNSEVSRWLDTLDEIKERAGIGEAIVPVHTGRAIAEVGAERARGATRLDDWADVRWMLNKDNLGQRFFSATGRDVEFAEAGLTYDKDTRCLTITGGDRNASKTASLANATYGAIANTPGMSKADVTRTVRLVLSGASNDSIRTAITDLVAAGRVRYREGGPHGSIQCFAVEHPDVFRGAE